MKKLSLISIFSLCIGFVTSLNASLAPLFLEDLKSNNLDSLFHTEDIDCYGKDFGNIITTKPAGVFMPRSVNHLQAFLPLANKHEIRISARGEGCSAFGQSQVQAGIIVDLSKMQTSYSINNNHGRPVIQVPSHWTWSQVISKSLEQGLTVPVTIDNLSLSLGGVLSFCGVGGSSHQRGGCVDNVISFQIVTMDGHKHWCGKYGEEQPELFGAALCGLGQFGIITQVTIPLVPAPEEVAYFRVGYHNPKKFFDDQKTLYESGFFDYLKGFVRKVDNKWNYFIEAGSYGQEDNSSARAELLKNLPYDPQKIPYLDFINQVTKFTEALKEKGALNNPLPWYSILVPENAIQEHLALALDSKFLTGTEPIIVYPMNSKHFKMPFFKRPEGTFYLLGVLYNTSFEGTPDYPKDEVLKHNKDLYKLAKEQGGFRYPVDATPFTRPDWEEHFGSQWPEFLRLKMQYDPKNLLGTGHGIF